MTTRRIDATYMVIGILFIIAAASLGLFWQKETAPNKITAAVIEQNEPQAPLVQAKTNVAPKKSQPAAPKEQSEQTPTPQNTAPVTTKPTKKSGGGGGGSSSTPTNTPKIPPATSVKKGDTLKIYVNANSIKDLSGAQIDLNYDSQIVSLTSINEGSFLDQGNPNAAIFIQPKTLVAASSGRLSNLLVFRLEPTGASGSGDVAVITFKALADGEPTVKLSNVLLSNSQAKPISSQLSLTSKIL